MRRPLKHDEHQLDPDSVKFLRISSAKALQDVQPNPPQLDFILVDGNRKVRYVTEDLQWTRFLQLGGLGRLHDCRPKFPRVSLNAKRFLRKHPNYKILSHAGSLLILRKSNPSSQSEITWIERLRASIFSPYFQLKASVVKRLTKS